MNTLFRSVDTLETEGDAREAYAAWMADMANTTIVEGSGKAVVIDLEVEDLPFQVENKVLSLTEILVVIAVLNGCFWGLVWGMSRIDSMENNDSTVTVLSEDEELIEIEVPTKKAYEDDDIIIEEL